MRLTEKLDGFPVGNDILELSTSPVDIMAAGGEDLPPRGDGVEDVALFLFFLSSKKASG